jgi:hypothetical protein
VFRDKKEYCMEKKVGVNLFKFNQVKTAGDQAAEQQPGYDNSCSPAALKLP